MTSSCRRPFPPSKIGPLEDVDYSRMRMPIFVVYDHPSDFSDHFVVRVFDLDTPTPYVELFDTMELVHAAMPAPSTWMPRHPYDDAKIVGCFI